MYEITNKAGVRGSEKQLFSQAITANPEKDAGKSPEC